MALDAFCSQRGHGDRQPVGAVLGFGEVLWALPETQAANCRIGANEDIDVDALVDGSALIGKRGKGHVRGVARTLAKDCFGRTQNPGQPKNSATAALTLPLRR